MLPHVVITDESLREADKKKSLLTNMIADFSWSAQRVH